MRTTGLKLPILAMLLLAALLVLATTACGATSEATEAGEDVPAAVAQSADREAPPTDTIEVSNAGAPLETWGGALDPQAVVAAQGVVLNRIYNQLLPSVVHIDTYRRVDSATFGGFPFSTSPGAGPQTLPDRFVLGEGSGFVWSEDGHIVTSYHVVEGADRLTVTFHDGAIVEAELLGGDPDSDLAVLRLTEPRTEIGAARLGDSAAVEVGQLVAAIGSPFGREFTLTSGIISAAGRSLPAGNLGFSLAGVIQTDAAINPGSSGGPLLDMYGNVIGINARIASSSGVSAGVGFAVPINAAKVIIPSLMREGEYAYSWLGIRGTLVSASIADEIGLPSDIRGVLVIEAIEDGPASGAGMRGVSSRESLDGDIIVAINGNVVEAMDDIIAYLLEQTAPGDTVTLGIIRDGSGSPLDMDVVLGTRPSGDPAAP